MHLFIVYLLEAQGWGTKACSAGSLAWKRNDAEDADATDGATGSDMPTMSPENWATAKLLVNQPAGGEGIVTHAQPSWEPRSTLFPMSCGKHVRSRPHHENTQPSQDGESTQLDGFYVSTNLSKHNQPLNNDGEMSVWSSLAPIIMVKTPM